MNTIQGIRNKNLFILGVIILIIISLGYVFFQTEMLYIASQETRKEDNATNDTVGSEKVSKSIAFNNSDGFTPLGLDPADIPLSTKQELQSEVRSLFDQVESDAVHEKALEVIRSIPQPTDEQIKSIQASLRENGIEGVLPKLKEVFGENIDPVLVEKVSLQQALEAYRRNMIGNMFYGERSIDWPTFLAASIENSDMTADEFSRLLSVDEFSKVTDTEGIADYHDMGKAAFTPPHPSETFVRFPDIVQYSSMIDGQKQPIIATDDILYQYVAPETVQKVIDLDSRINFVEKANIPENISQQEQVRRSDELTQQFNLQSHNLLGDQGYEIFFGKQYQTATQ